MTHLIFTGVLFLFYLDAHVAFLHVFWKLLPSLKYVLLFLMCFCSLLALPALSDAFDIAIDYHV